MNGYSTICLIASAGGHLSQLLKLENAWHGCDVFYVTTVSTAAKKLEQLGRFYVVGECNREHPWQALKVFVRCLKIVLNEKPDIVISTGAAPGCIMCFLGRMLGARVVWIDSITNVERISLSGRMVRYIADLFLVQWPELAERYGNVEYAGAVI